VNNLTGGSTDTSLTDLGRKQAACLAVRLKGELEGEQYAYYSSDLKRALQTADIIGEALGTSPKAISGLREVNTGEAAWKTRDWAMANQPPRPPKGKGLDRRPFPRAETPREFYERVSNCMKSILPKDLLLLIVSHGGTVGAIIAWWLQLSPETYDLVLFKAAPGSISILGESRWKERMIMRLNDLGHFYKATLSKVPPLLQKKH
jgi:probable phosphoglycerate mutase